MPHSTPHAAPEQESSINQKVLDNRTSLNDETITSLRIVNTLILLNGGIEKLPICRKLLTSVLNSYSAYEELNKTTC